MNNDLNKVILSEDDYRQLKQFATKGSANNEMSLAHEISRAKIVKREELPADVISLNSLVRIKELTTNREMEFTIVMPAQADIKTQKISVLTPMGSALIGLQKGVQVDWKMPAGMRRLEILDVQHSA
ncbi:nucleoside diphosphate kinase regulator [Dyadobacter tibetensis]|uniref:nucleoside diphosphate kinase regulator n=1 Tax=Dyadobacter tibetensis TaxID=1211851 RepID=UPI00047298B4|nr:nucleoside diphosphate kinase regulator [Dyadobacter tibetensis]